MATSQAKLAARLEYFCKNINAQAARYSALIAQNFGYEEEADFWMRLVGPNQEIYRIYVSKIMRCHILIDCTKGNEYVVSPRHRASARRPLTLELLERVERALPFPREVAWGTHEYGLINELLFFSKGTICLPEGETNAVPSVRLATNRQRARQSLCARAVQQDGMVNLEAFWELVRGQAITPLVMTLARSRFLEYSTATPPSSEGIYTINGELFMHPDEWERYSGAAMTCLGSVKWPRIDLPEM